MRVQRPWQPPATPPESPQLAVKNLADLRQQIEAVEARIAAADSAMHSAAAELAQVTAELAEAGGQSGVP